MNDLVGAAALLFGWVELNMANPKIAQFRG